MSNTTSNGTKRRLGGVRITVVEDRSDHLELATRALMAAGAIVRGFASGQEAFDGIHADMPDALVVDLGLPDVSGTALVRRVRALPAGASVVIVAYTAAGSPEKRAEALKHGFEYYVNKPDLERLVHVIGHGMGR